MTEIKFLESTQQTDLGYRFVQGIRLTLLFLIFTLAVNAKDTTGIEKFSKIINQAIHDANSTIQKNILQTSLSMVQNKIVVKGSCWDYINRVYKNANVTKKIVIFKNKKSGPYARVSQLRSGDWIYHVNHSYGDIEHSGLFVAWIDTSSAKALMLSYAGEGRSTPARFKIYNIDKTYNIIRARGQKSTQIKPTLKELMQEIASLKARVSKLEKRLH